MMESGGGGQQAIEGELAGAGMDRRFAATRAGHVQVERLAFVSGGQMRQANGRAHFDRRTAAGAAIPGFGEAQIVPFGVKSPRPA